jgi:RNA ligase (TIGR02306 family)
MNSTHTVEVVDINLENHPNADSLSIVRIGGYTVCVNTEQWKGKNRGAYIVPESVVDTTRPEFAFLHKGRQLEVIKVKKLRGVYSQGLLVPAQDDWELGRNVADELGVTHYEPSATKEKLTPGDCEKDPINVSKYDVDTLRKYRYVLTDGEPIVVTEKIHGCFKADTLVLTETGYVPIKDIKPNDIVASYSVKTKEFRMNKVAATLCRPSNDTKWRKLTLENGKEITCTENHLFLTKTGWVEARNLTPQHEIVSVS